MGASRRREKAREDGPKTMRSFPSAPLRAPEGVLGTLITIRGSSGEGVVIREIINDNSPIKNCQSLQKLWDGRIVVLYDEG